MPSYAQSRLSRRAGNERVINISEFPFPNNGNIVVIKLPEKYENNNNNIFFRVSNQLTGIWYQIDLPKVMPSFMIYPSTFLTLSVHSSSTLFSFSFIFHSFL